MGEDMEAAMVAAEDTVEAMADTVEREKPKPNPKLMLNQKPTLWLKPMLMPMLTMDMVVMVDTVMDMVDTDMAVNQLSMKFNVPKNHKNDLFPTYQRKIQTASF